MCRSIFYTNNNKNNLVLCHHTTTFDRILHLFCLILSLLISLRYWKISLLVHPDKCSHPQANQAFIKLNKAFKELQDPEKVSLAGDLFIIEVNIAFGWV